VFTSTRRSVTFPSNVKSSNVKYGFSCGGTMKIGPRTGPGIKTVVAP
jgi:hypothetical protein